MDVLSDVIATMRTGQPRAARHPWRAPWGQHYPAVPGASFHVVLRGSCWLIRPAAVGVAFANAFKREYGVAPGRYRRQVSQPVTAAQPVTTATTVLPGANEPA